MVCFSSGWQRPERGAETRERLSAAQAGAGAWVPAAASVNSPNPSPVISLLPCPIPIPPRDLGWEPQPSLQPNPFFSERHTLGAGSQRRSCLLLCQLRTDPGAKLITRVAVGTQEPRGGGLQKKSQFTEWVKTTPPKKKHHLAGGIRPQNSVVCCLFAFRASGWRQFAAQGGLGQAGQVRGGSCWGWGPLGQVGN